VILAPVAGRIADRYGAFPTALVCVAASSVFVAFYGWFDALAVLTLIALLNSVVDSGATPATQAAVAAAGPPEQVAAGQGLLEAVGLAFAGFAALVAVPIYAAVGPELLFTVSSVIMLTFCGAARLFGLAPVDKTVAMGGSGEHAA
jgi:MFS family permease